MFHVYAMRYQCSADHVNTRASSCRRKLTTKAGEVELKSPRLRTLSFETQLIERYRQLLGLSDDRDVVEVDLDLSANRVTIDLQHAGGKLYCPECAQARSRADTAPKRTYGRLDTTQFPCCQRSPANLFRPSLYLGWQ